MVREARREDLPALLKLYLSLHETSVPEDSVHLRQVWEAILRDENRYLLVYEKDGELVSSCDCVILPNLTRGGKPYALIENVVTRTDSRGKGFAGECLARARELAAAAGCYKVMLMTGSRQESTLRFYRKAGFDSGEKTAFVLRLDH